MESKLKKKDRESHYLLTVMQRTLHPQYGWSSLRVLGTSRTVRSSYLWLMLVPIVAKCLSAVNEIATFTILSATISVPLSLPFSWKAFFFAALAFAVADLIWHIKCPGIIKKYSNYSDFVSQGRTVLDTKYYFLEAVPYFFIPSSTPYYEKMQTMEYLKRFIKAATGRRISMLTEDDIKFFMNQSDIPTQNVDKIIGYEVKKEKESDLFHFVIKYSENIHFGWLRFCTACYLIGFLLMIIVLLQSIWAVINI